MKKISEVEVLFVNNWGDNPNKRVYHILKNLNQNGINSIMIGRKNSIIPKDPRIFFLDVPANNKNEFAKSSFFFLKISIKYNIQDK